MSELTQLRCQDAELGIGAHLRCHGKGRKDRITPLTMQTAAVLRTWLREPDGTPADPLSPTRCGGPLSRDAVEFLLTKHAGPAAQHCPSLRDRKLLTIRAAKPDKNPR